MVVALVYIVGAVTSIAAEKIKLSGTRYWFITKSEEIKLDDVEGHILQIRDAKGVDVGWKRSVSPSTLFGEGQWNFSWLLNLDGA